MFLEAWVFSEAFSIFPTFCGFSPLWTPYWTNLWVDPKYLLLSSDLHYFMGILQFWLVLEDKFEYLLQSLYSPGSFPVCMLLHLLRFDDSNEAFLWLPHLYLLPFLQYYLFSKVYIWKFHETVCQVHYICKTYLCYWHSDGQNALSTDPILSPV